MREKDGVIKKIDVNIKSCNTIHCSAVLHICDTYKAYMYTVNIHPISGYGYPDIRYPDIDIGYPSDIRISDIPISDILDPISISDIRYRISGLSDFFIYF